MLRWSLALVSLVGCGDGGGSDSVTTDAARDAPASSPHDAPVTPGHDAPPAADAAPSGDAGLDGTPTRQQCTSHFGSALPSSGTFGRLDGYLVAVVSPGQTNGCNDDDSHVHLQIQMNNAIYDIAIDVTDGTTGVDDVHTGTLEVALPGPAWAEGFHTGASIDYPTLGVHASTLPLQTKAQMISDIEGDLTSANHVSIYSTTYGGDGAHLVHRNGGGQDGVLVTEPLSTPSHLRLFSFSDQSF